ncbi:unnamed protein product [Rhizophagus irregularis]|nr:unnamed protein product [Rhizophagus irregularis]
MSDTRLSFATATRLAAKLPALYANARAKYPPRQVESFIDFDELLLIYDAPLRHVESFIDFDELPSVYDVPLLLRSFNTFTLIDDSDTTLMMNRIILMTTRNFLSYLLMTLLLSLSPILSFLFRLSFLYFAWILVL